MRRALIAIGLGIGSLACSEYPTEVRSEACDDLSDPPTRECEWRGQIAAGRRIEIFGINGRIEASLASGNEVVVSWVKRGSRHDPSEVTIEVVTHDHGVTICAVYPSPSGSPANSCLPDGGGTNNVRDNDVEVTFTVSVPEGVHLHGSLVTGDIEAEGLRSDAFASTVTGYVTVSTTGVATASTVTGSVFASIGAPNWDRDLAFSTVTGDVTVEIPSSTNADVYASAVTGHVFSDFPLSKDSTGGWRATLGSGGRTLIAATVTGSVRLRWGA
jgi:hypothetical protein